MPFNQSFFHGLSVTMEPHCALNTAKKSLDSMSNNSYRKIQNSLLKVFSRNLVIKFTCNTCY